MIVIATVFLNSKSEQMVGKNQLRRNQHKMFSNAKIMKNIGIILIMRKKQHGAD